jgi:arginyl-tRNA synthetase
MPFLNPQQQADLDAQRFDAPIRSAVERAMRSLGVELGVGMLDPTQQEGFDAQTRAGFLLCKPLKISPIQAGSKLANALSAELGPLGSCAHSAGTAFVNIAFADDWIAQRMRSMSDMFPRLGQVDAIVDYSSPNCAKRMHVGHLRSTVIGDALCRLLEASGAGVERVNHLGDWGTPFGVIIEQARDESLDLGSLTLADIEQVYKRGSARFSAATTVLGSDATAEQTAAWISSRDDGLDFAQRARAATASMQAKQEPAFSSWSAIRASTLRELQETYQALDIGLEPRHAIGESAYQDEIGPIIDDLCARGIATKSSMGVAFLGGKIPLGLEKSAERGGGYLYGGTDAAALKRRAATGKKLLYVTDDRQADHFESLFELGKQAGWTTSDQAMHVPFGMMLDKTGKPFKSRSGEVIALTDLVDLALDEARAAILKREPNLSSAEIDLFARPIGVGALKYGDLSRSRTSAIKFDLQQASSLEGDTGPFLQYARVRAYSAAQAAKNLPESPRDKTKLHPSERALAIAMSRMRDGAIESISTLEPHKLCQSIYSAANAFNAFYEHCPCVQEGHADPLRLELMERFSSIMASAISCLGIQPLDSMPRGPKPAVRSLAL